ARRKDHIKLGDLIGGRTGGRHTGCSWLAEQRHRSAPRNLDQDNRYASIVHISQTDDQLTRGHRSLHPARPAQPRLGGTLPNSTPKPRQTTIHSSAATRLTWPDTGSTTNPMLARATGCDREVIDRLRLPPVVEMTRDETSTGSARPSSATWGY